MSTEFTWSLVGIATKAQLKTLNRSFKAMGKDNSAGDGRSFSAPLSASGKEPATHYGFQTVAKPSEKTELTDMKAGTLPGRAKWEDHKTTKAEVRSALPSMILDWSQTLDGASHYDAVLSASNLKRIESNTI